MDSYGYPGLTLVFQLLWQHLLYWCKLFKHWLDFTPVGLNSRREFQYFFNFEPEWIATSQGKLLVLRQLRSLATEAKLDFDINHNYNKLYGTRYLNQLYLNRSNQSAKAFDTALRSARRYGYQFGNADSYQDFLPEDENPLTFPELLPEFTKILVN